MNNVINLTQYKKRLAWTCPDCDFCPLGDTPDIELEALRLRERGRDCPRDECGVRRWLENNAAQTKACRKCGYDIWRSDRSDEEKLTFLRIHCGDDCEVKASLRERGVDLD